MCEFKILDRVENIYSKLQGTIIDIDVDELGRNILGRNILVEYDEPIPGGHDGNSSKIKGKDGHCWWEKKDMLRRLIPNYEAHTQEEVDDMLEHEKIINTRYAETIANLNDELAKKEDIIQDLNKRLDNVDLAIDKKDNIIRNLSEMLIDLTNEEV